MGFKIQFEAFGHGNNDFCILDGSVMKTFDPRVDYGHYFLFACKPLGMETRINFWSPKCGWGCGQG